MKPFKVRVARAGRSVQRQDGYKNMLNKYGTSGDNSTAYYFQPESVVPDIELTIHYESNGLFSKIIDAPAEESVKHGFTLDGEVSEAVDILNDALEALDWEEKSVTAIKWSRLYGGAIIVMLIDDGGGIDEPLNRDNIRGIDDIRVYERPIVQPDWATARFGEPQLFNVSSESGFFKVHESRCLVFKNGILPETTFNTDYKYWGMPEYIRIKNELRECSTAHGLGVKLLDRSVQAIYSMKGLADLVTTEDGEDKVVRRLQLIDRARGVLNSIAIDADGENYDFKSIPFSGVKDIIDTTCNMLSAVTSIPQTVLFGRSPAGENSTGQSDFENYYNLCERIQKMMLRGNLKRLSEVIFRAARSKGDLGEVPPVKISFNPLWNESESEKATIDQAKASAALTKAQTAQVYCDMGAIDPTEVRAKLASSDEFNVETMLDDLPDGELMKGWDTPLDVSEEPIPETGEIQ